ncbi:MAG TPA: hypothetical protein ENJ95_08800 [Bacteroidetes bacterium]|nr:hypothetical protein [Bacteroidota bacterium]
MKYLILNFLALFFATALFSQNDETLFSHVDRIGAFGGPIIEYADLSGDVETSTGGGGALVLNDFFIGGYGHGTSELNKSFQAENLKERVKFKHGGFWLGYVPVQHKVIHPYTSLKMGWGKARFRKSEIGNNETVDEFKDNIFVLTPEAGIELNVFSFFRISATANYRLVSGIDKLDNFSDSDFSGFGAVLTLRFGGFGSEWDID